MMDFYTDPPVRETFWVANESNFHAPIRLYDIDQAARLADQIKGMVITQSNGTWHVVYSHGEREVLHG